MWWETATEALMEKEAGMCECVCRVHNDIKLNSSTIFIYYKYTHFYVHVGKQIVLNLFNDESAHVIESEGKLRA